MAAFGAKRTLGRMTAFGAKRTLGRPGLNDRFWVKRTFAGSQCNVACQQRAGEATGGLACGRLMPSDQTVRGSDGRPWIRAS